MTDIHPEDLHVHLTVDDARTAQLAGAKFARTLGGADPEDYALALAEQEHLVERGIVDAGFGKEQARLAAGHSARRRAQLDGRSGRRLRSHEQA